MGFGGPENHPGIIGRKLYNLMNMAMYRGKCMPNFYVYMLQCSDYSYYVGNTGDLTLRMYQHEIGEASDYTCNRRPVTLVWHKQFETRQEAFMVERKVKGWSRAKKMH